MRSNLSKNSPKRALLRAVFTALVGYSIIFVVSALWIRLSVIDTFKNHQIVVARQAISSINNYIEKTGLTESLQSELLRRRFDKSLKARTYGLGISKVRIFDTSSKLVYTTESSDLREISALDQPRIERILRAEANEEFIGLESASREFEYFGPLYSNQNKIVGVVEVYFDLWSMSENISAATKNVLISSIISFALFTIVLFVYSLGLFRKMEAAREAKIQSDRKALELQDMARVGLFISGLAHQLKNPIAILLGLVNALKKRESLPAQKEFIEGLDLETSRMENLVENFLRFARPINKIQQKHTTDVGVVIERVVNSFQRANPQIQFEVRLQDNGLSEIPEHLLIEVIDVVVRNSLNALQGMDSPSIVVKLSKMIDRLTIFISDNGRGLSGEIAKKPDLAFEPFLSTKPGGHGLGLAMAKRIVEEFGGEIRIKPREPIGVVVEILLPAKR